MNEEAKPAALKIGIPKETGSGLEQRVSLVPEEVRWWVNAGARVLVESGSGVGAGYSDDDYRKAGAEITDKALEAADVVIALAAPTTATIGRLQAGATVIGMLRPYDNLPILDALADRQVTSFSLELIPRITRAQAMDVLSGMSTVIGYKAVLLAAVRSPQIFPLLMTALGTVRPARVLVLGAGVAGLQAIGTARHLGAVVKAYDVRPTVKEQVESVGGKFVDLSLSATDSQDKQGYATLQGQDFYQQQQQLLIPHIAEADVVISTALVPGKKAPVLISTEAVKQMRPGSVVVDLAAEHGGNCEVSVAGQEVLFHGVLVLGPINPASSVPRTSSQFYSRAASNYLRHLWREGRLVIDQTDPLTSDPLLTYQGKIVNKLFRR